MYSPGFKKFGKRVLQIGLPVIILALFVYQVKKNWADLTVYTFQLNPWLLALSFLGFMLQELSYGLIWRAVLARLRKDWFITARVAVRYSRDRKHYHPFYRLASAYS